MDFPEKFELWLSSALAEDVPEAVIAFSFNLCELSSADAKFGIELIGASEFDSDDSDWACDEAWVPTAGRLALPLAFANGNWKACLSSAKRLVQSTLAKSSAASATLKSVEAVAIGFVDGDLEILWQRSNIS